MSDLHRQARKESQAAGLRFHITQWDTCMAFTAASHPSKCLRASHRTFVMNYGGHTPSAGVTGKSKRECFLCKVEPQGCRCPRLHAFLETKHFHGSFGPWAIFLLKKWEKFPHTDGKKKKITSAGLIQRQRLFWSRRQIEGWVAGGRTAADFKSTLNVSSGAHSVCSCLRTPTWVGVGLGDLGPLWCWVALSLQEQLQLPGSPPCSLSCWEPCTTSPVLRGRLSSSGSLVSEILLLVTKSVADWPCF